MAQAPASPITEERFKKGKTFQEYLDSGIRNRELFEQNYNGLEVSDAQAAALKAAKAKKGLDHMAVIGEDWCPDVYRGLPVLARLAEAAGIEFKSLPRDQNLDIMNAYLNKGEFQSVPCALFYTGNMDLILSWHERPEKANQEIHQMRDIVGSRTREEAADDLLKFRRGPVWAGWRGATIDELISLLEAKVG